MNCCLLGLLLVAAYAYAFNFNSRIATRKFPQQLKPIEMVLIVMFFT